jgi:hypothetical protein
MRWTLLKDADKLNLAQLTDLEPLVSQYTTNRTARARLYREQLRDILERKQINVVSEMLQQWCTNVMRSKVEPMKKVVRLVRRHFDGIVAWTQTRQTNDFIEAITAYFRPQSVKLVDMHASKPSAQSSSSSLESSTFLALMKTPAEPQHPLRFQKSRKTALDLTCSSRVKSKRDGGIVRTENYRTLRCK